jgi:hypothetical protein
MNCGGRGGESYEMVTFNRMIRVECLVSIACRVFDHASPIRTTPPHASSTQISPVQPNMSPSPVLPAPYFYFFFLIEPVCLQVVPPTITHFPPAQILTLAGAAYAIFLPETYGRELLPRGVEALSNGVGASTRGRLLVGCLGNCTLRPTPVTNKASPC